MADNFDLEELVHLEQTFYDAGYTDGFAHGRIHGLIEGRALGREKGFEIWEEIGFYEGFARTWRAIYAQRGHRDQRTVHHITHLLDLVRRFPTVNPSTTMASSCSSSPSDAPEQERENGEDDALDLSKLQSQIRSRYKALCASLGVRPVLRAASALSVDVRNGNLAADADGTEVSASEGGMGDDAHQQNVRAKRDVWALEDDIRRPTMKGLSF